MAATSGVDAMTFIFNALSGEEQEEAYARIGEMRLRRLAGGESSMARFIRSLQRVAEELGEVPSIDDYKRVSEQLIAAGEDIETFARLYKHFGTWPRAKEALGLSETTTARRIDARFRYRKVGKVWRFTEESMRDAIMRSAKHYGRPPTTAEFEWWRDRELELARAAGDDCLQLPSTSPYRRRYGSWEGALLHFGFTAEEAAARLDYRNSFVGPDPDAHLPEGLPVAKLRKAGSSLSAPLTTDEVERLRAGYEALPRRSRYILTARLALGMPKLTLAQTAKPLGLHLGRISQVQLLSLNALAEAVTGVGRDKPDPVNLHDPITETLRQLAVLPGAGEG